MAMLSTDMLKALTNTKLMVPSNSSYKGKNKAKACDMRQQLVPICHTRGSTTCLACLWNNDWLVTGWAGPSSGDERSAAEGAAAGFPVPHWVQGTHFLPAFLCLCRKPAR